MEARECSNIPRDARVHNALQVRALVGRRRRPPGNPRSQMSERDYAVAAGPVGVVGHVKRDYNRPACP